MDSHPQAYIFDLDGVLVRSMPAHFACYRQALEEVGVPIDERQFYRQAGMTGREQIAYFARKAGVEVNVDEVYRRNRALKAFHAHQITPILANIELLKTLRAAGHRTAIASGAAEDTVASAMSRFAIEADAVVTGDDVARGKPHPDLFLEAAARLGVPPERCTVVEDSDVGVEAARAAGMHVLRYYDGEGHPTA